MVEKKSDEFEETDLEGSIKDSLDAIDDESTEKSEDADAEPENDETDDSADPVIEEEAPKETNTKLSKETKHSSIHTFFASKKRRTVSIVAAVILVVAILLAIPFTRYAILGLVIKKDVTIVVLDKTTNRPVSDASITLDGTSGTTDKNGNATLKGVSVSNSTLVITKKYYTSDSQSYTVPVLSHPTNLTIKLVATGRQVTLHVTNKITADPLQGVKVSADGTSTITDKLGVAVIILPTTKATQDATLSEASYNDTTAAISVNDVNAANAYTMTPSGTIYYLSNSTGTTNVMKSNLDGTNSAVVVAGTGFEDNQATLLAAQDWQYVALQSIRQSDALSRIYIIDDKTNTLKLIDQSGSSYQLIGWSGHNFLYEVVKAEPNQWTNGQYVIKSYNADSGVSTVIDQSTALGSDEGGFEAQYFTNPYIIGSTLFYIKAWSYGYGLQYTDTNQSLAVMTSDFSGNKKVVKDISDQYNTYINTSEYEPGDIYIDVTTDGTASYYEFEDGTLSTSNITDAQFNTSYPTYLYSPSGTQTLWYEIRNGNNTLFIGDKDGDNPRTIATSSSYTPFGWYGDGYIILSKGGSELYIASSTKPLTSSYQGLDITSYQSTQNSYRGYGSGYGGAL
jgi:hypothetical protein